MSEVELKRKVTLKSKGSGNATPKRGSSWKLWIFLCVVVAGTAVIFVKKFSSDKNRDTNVATVSPLPSTTTTTPVDKKTQEDSVTPSAVEVNSEAPTESTSTPTNSSSAAQPVTNPDRRTESAAAKESASAHQPDVSSDSNPAEAKPVVSDPSMGGVEEKALQVIRGDFGNGDERKRNLGNEYDAIQQRVNELYREGRIN